MIQEPNLWLEMLKAFGVVIVIAFALVGFFSTIGGIMLIVKDHRRKSKLDRDIERWAKFKAKYDRTHAKEN